MHRIAAFAVLGLEYELFGFDGLSELLFGDACRRVGEDLHGYRTVEFGRKSVDALDLLQGHAEVDHIHPVVQPFDTQSDDIEHGHRLVRRLVFAVGRREDGLLQFKRIGLRGVVRDDYGVAFDERFDAVDARHGLHLGGERLRRAEAFYRLQSLHFVGLHVLDLFILAPFLIDGR